MGIYDNTDNMSADLIERVEDGMGCGSYLVDKWASIVNQLNEDIAEIDPGYKVDQIKAKFGMLRYYITTSIAITQDQRARIHALVSEAEEAANNRGT